MRILLVGSASKYAIEKSYLKYLSENALVSCVKLFPAQNLFLEFYHKSVLHKVAYRVGLTQILTQINILLVNEVEAFKPNVIFIFKGMEIFPSTLKAFRLQGIKLVNYNPDNPFLFTGRGSGNRNITDSISLYDFHFTYSKTIGNTLSNTTNTPVRILPFGFDLSSEDFELSQMHEECLKVAFVGNPDKRRSAFIYNLAAGGVSIDVFGDGWNKFVSHPNIISHNSVYDNSLWDTLRKYRVQLNIMRIHNLDSHNMRTFEIPAVGGIQLAPDTKDHHVYFTPEVDIFLYKNTADCLRVINDICHMSKRSAAAFRSSARERSLHSGYSYKDRTNYVVSEIANSLWK